MKRIVSLGLFAAVLLLALTGCGIRRKAPDDWYKETLEYYTDGFGSDWENERSDLYVSDEMKDSNNRFGYLLRDLDGDGTVEVLIGIIDDSDETKFIDIYIWHRDFGSFRSIHSGGGYYVYLCDNNVLKEDSWYGSETKTRYMRYDSENNSFHILDTESQPQKVELTAFEY